MELRLRLQAILAGCIAEHASQSGETLEIPDDGALLGGHALLDSLGLVTILAFFEGEISDELGVDVLFANERAMSQERSPFRTPTTLVDYALMLVREKQDGCA